MKTNKTKLRAMIYGAFYGDAYSLGGHWIYDTQALKDASFSLDTCNDPISSYHPTKHKGDFTHYGDQMLWLLQDLVEEGMFCITCFGNKWHKNMKEYTGYIDGATKHTMKQLDIHKNYFTCGSKSSDLGAVSRMFPIILKYRNSIESMKDSIKIHTILTHTNKDLIQVAYFFSQLVMGVLAGLDLEEVINSSCENFGDNISKWIQEAKWAQALDTKEAILKLGQSCSVNGAFASTIYILLKHKDNFKEALKANMLAGGDSSARGMIIGAILAIVHSKEVLEGSFVKQLNKDEEIESLVNKLLA